jgi:hypothetical protein
LFFYLYETEIPVLLKLTPETVSSKEKVWFFGYFPFYIERRIRNEKIIGSGSGIWDKTFRVPNTDRYGTDTASYSIILFLLLLLF